MPVAIQYILTGIGLLFTISYGYGTIKQGGNQGKIDTITILKEEVASLQGKVEELSKRVQELTNDLNLKDKKLTATLEILQGRDPTMVDFIKAGQAYMTVTLPVVERLNKYLDKTSF